MYSSVTNDVISLVEQSLVEEWELEEYAQQVGYSKFHLSRVFRQETGMSIREYIRKRRLAVAAMHLLYTDEGILQLAVQLGFQSQEAFTRAFKSLYHLPPGKYRNLMRTLQRTEEDGMNETMVKGWFLSGSQPELYEMKTDREVVHTGVQSAKLAALQKMNEGQFATVMQSISAEKYRGKRVRVSCFLKSVEAEKAAAWCRVDNQAGDTLQFDNMDDRFVSGTTEWQYYAVVLDVPEDSTSIHFGFMLVGGGSVWADDFRFEEVALSVTSTNMLGREELPEEPVNLSFEV